MAQVSLKQLEAFVAVADLGTFRRAAERLNTTQPNISARIAQLEAQMKVSLMERDAGSVRLTPRGRVLLARARAVLGEVDQFIAAAGDSTLFEGVLRLGVSELVAHTWLRPFLLEMRARYPSVTVELTVEQSAHLSPLLFGGDLDLTFQNGPFDRRATSTRPLGAAPYLWAASRRWGWGGARWNPAELARHQLLAHARGTEPYRQLAQHVRELRAGLRLVPTSNISTCLHMAVDGLGVTCLPRALLSASLDAGRLEALDYPWLPDALQFAARTMQATAPGYLLGAIEIAQELGVDDNGFLSSGS